MKTITCPSKEVPVIAETQVLVVGSGPVRVFLQLLPALDAGQKPCLLNGMAVLAAHFL